MITSTEKKENTYVNQRFRKIKYLAVSALFLINLPLSAQQGSDGLNIPPFREVPDRKPAFPLKSSRSLYSDAELEIARKNIEKYSTADKIRRDILKNADYWLTFSNEEILALMPDARVPRGFDLCAKGCPVHGDSIFKVGGTYPWIIDPKHPFQVKCPIDGEVYPSNDFKAYYFGGMKEKPKGKYADDGFGWVSPEGDRYWFVAHATQWMWMRHTIPGLLSLSRAYLLTKDPRYAERATFMLYRLAQVYPSMDHENQSRYGLMEKMKGNRYSGKILNRIWETSLIHQIAEAYDYVWDYFDKNRSLHQYSRKSSEEIRALIEANVLEEGLDAIEDGRIAGNFGMHQNAMLYLHLVRQHANKEQAIRKMTDMPSRQMAHNGLNYALYNQVFRDGMPLESPGYNSHWLSKLVEIGEVLNRGGQNIFQNPRFRNLLSAPIDIVAIGQYTPDWGDGGSATGGLIARFTDTYQIGYGQFKDKRYLEWIGKGGESSFSTFESLFREALPPVDPLPGGRATRPTESRLFAGYGLGILNNKPDKTALAFTYGMHYSHYHWDFLNIELFANGQKMMPDLGYPDAMNAYVAPVYTWSQNTISHNTVVVDAKKQRQNLPGMLHDFYEGEFARVADFSSPAYAQATTYRRKVFLVDAGHDQSYVVDFFDVAGGTQHDYSLHGPPGKVLFAQDEWTKPAKGTLAGENVALEELYDDPNLKANGSKRGYVSYGGSGFQHLFNVQKKTKGSGMIEYHHLHDSTARLRLHTLTPEVDELFLADAYDLPRAKKHLLKYLIARRIAKNAEPLKSTFVSVFEPYKGDQPLVDRAELSKPDEGHGQVVKVQRGDLLDIVLHDSTGTVKKLKSIGLETDAASAVVTVDRRGKLVRVFFSGGSYLHVGKQKFRSQSIKGTVEKLDIDKKEVIVRLNTGNHKGTNDQVKIAHFTNAHRTTVHPVHIQQSGGSGLTLRVTDDLLVARLQVVDAKENEIRTNTSLTFQHQYSGVTLMNSDYQPLSTVTRVNGDRIQLTGPTSMPVEKNAVLWLSNLGPGDEFEIKPGFSRVLR